MQCKKACPLYPQADKPGHNRIVRFVPIADISPSFICKQKDRLCGGLSEISCAHKSAVREPPTAIPLRSAETGDLP